MPINSAKHEVCHGLLILAPVLCLLGGNNTDTKIGLFRRIFDHLDLDPEELVFTLRPHKTTSKDEEAIEDRPNAFASLTKFRDAVTEVAALQPDASGTANLREEFAAEFEPFKRESWMQDIGEEPLAAFLSATTIDTMAPEE